MFLFEETSMRASLSVLFAVLLPGVGVSAAPMCTAQSAAVAPWVVELYTSEGCSSCPPADRWLSTVKNRRDVVALAFHVDYWNSLGWVDRFASPAWSQRQRAVSVRSGAGFVYTPQVLLNGRDYRRWPLLPASSQPALLTLRLQRDGNRYVADITRKAGTPALAGYWVVTEDGYQTPVKAGENAGVTLHHDAVVQELQPLASVNDGELSFTPKAQTTPSVLPRHVVLVITDARTGLPIQALAAGC
jgi:hypothetical protein